MVPLIGLVLTGGFSLLGSSFQLVGDSQSLNAEWCTLALSKLHTGSQPV